MPQPYKWGSKKICDTCNKIQLSSPWFFCDNIIPYHQTIAADLTVISSHYQELDFSDIVSMYRWLEAEKRNPTYGIYFIFSEWGILIKSRPVFLIWLLNTIKEVCTPSPFKNHASSMKPQTSPYRAVSGIVRLTFRICTFKFIFNNIFKKNNCLACFLSK